MEEKVLKTQFINEQIVGNVNLITTPAYLLKTLAAGGEKSVENANTS